MSWFRAARGAPATPGCRTQRLTIDTRTTDLRVPLAWGTGQELTLWSIRWEEAGAAAELPLATGKLDGFDGLALDMAPFAGEMGPLLLVLEDTSGGCSSVGQRGVCPSIAHMSSRCKIDVLSVSPKAKTLGG